MSEAEDDDKPHEPSQKRLDDARRKGEVPRSQDLSAAAAYAGFLLAGLWLGGGVMTSLGGICETLLRQPERLAPVLSRSATAPVGGLVLDVAVAVAPLFLMPGLAALAAMAAQRSLILAPEKLEPKLDRISPLSGWRNRFGRNGLFEFGKSVIKLLVVGLLFALCLRERIDEIMGMFRTEPRIALGIMLDLLLDFLLLVVLLSVVIGGLDFLWQRSEHLRRHRMSRQELADETKDSEGDPHVKAQRRRRAVDVATNTMLQDVPKADVIVVNPTHYAVALQWKRGNRRAPVCLAKGVDEVAARIRERAAEAGVPIHRDPPTARALHASVRIGEEIRPEHYRAVAAAIRFSETIRRKARGRKP